MAAPGWKSDLSNHPLFDELAVNAELSKTAASLKNILVVQDNILYVWDDANACIKSVNLRLFGKTRSSSREEKEKVPPIKQLLCTDSPLFTVNQILFSPSGCHLALIGKQGLSILEIPPGWCRSSNQNWLPDSKLCQTIVVGERRLIGGSLQILDIKWYPASETETILVILTSDGKLSFYDIREPQDPVQEIILSDDIRASNVSDCPSMFDIVLGEIPVSFDFGQPINLAQTHSNKTSAAGETITYPIYVLWGNGNIHMVITSLTSQLLTKPLILGPLEMQPPAEDNYGVDACSLICLQTHPTVLVVATCSGTLYHCIVLDSTKEKMQSNTSKPPVVTEPVLYVYESVELELSLTTVAVEDDSRIDDDFACYIRLHHDPASPIRYHCSHSAGLHSVVVSWMKQMENYCLTDISSCPEPDQSKQSLIEHLICTKPLATSPMAPIQGVTGVRDSGLSAHLICLTSAYKCVILQMRSRCSTDLAPLASSSSHTLSSTTLKTEPFKKHIEKILARSTSNPLIKAPNKVDLTPQECFQLLTRATQVFREEYIHKQDLAKQEVDKKIRILSNLKRAQLQNLDTCEDERAAMIEHAERLAERVEEAEQKQRDIYERVETILHKVQSQLPVLSDAEKNMAKELGQLDSSLESLKIQLEQIKSKRKYQPKLNALNESMNSPKSLITMPQIMKLKTLLKDEGETIGENMRRLKLVKAQLNL